MTHPLLFLDGVYFYRHNISSGFQRIKVPDTSELEELVQLISKRVGALSGRACPVSAASALGATRLTGTGH